MALESIVERAAGILGNSTLKHEQKDANVKFLGGNDVSVFFTNRLRQKSLLCCFTLGF